MSLNNLFADYVSRDGIRNKLVPRYYLLCAAAVEYFFRSEYNLFVPCPNQMNAFNVILKLQRMLSELDLLISNYFRMSEFLAVLR